MNEPTGISYHEEVHARACRGEGLPVDWVERVERDGTVEVVVQSNFQGRGSAEGAAVALLAGALAHGGDADGDMDAALGLCDEFGFDYADIERRAMAYL